MVNYIWKMNNLCLWNVRDFNSIRKYKEVMRVLRKNNVVLSGYVETKIKIKNYGFLV